MLNYNHAIKTYGGVKVQPLAPERWTVSFTSWPLYHRIILI
jgi:hypothetical protein